MDEIFRIADIVTVLRDGRRIDSRVIGDCTLATLIADVMGNATRDLSEFNSASAVSPEVRDLARKSRTSLAHRRGEVLELAALLGSGPAGSFA
jgi:ribose transport system ATP-binding protein